MAQTSRHKHGGGASRARLALARARHAGSTRSRAILRKHSTCSAEACARLPPCGSWLLGPCTQGTPTTGPFLHHACWRFRAKPCHEHATCVGHQPAAGPAESPQRPVHDAAVKPCGRTDPPYHESGHLAPSTPPTSWHKKAVLTQFESHSRTAPHWAASRPPTRHVLREAACPCAFAEACP